MRPSRRHTVPTGSTQVLYPSPLFSSSSFYQSPDLRRCDRSLFEVGLRPTPRPSPATFRPQHPNLILQAPAQSHDRHLAGAWAQFGHLAKPRASPFTLLAAHTAFMRCFVPSFDFYLHPIASACLFPLLQSSLGYADRRHHALYPRSCHHFNWLEYDQSEHQQHTTATSATSSPLHRRRPRRSVTRWTSPRQ